MPDWVKHWQGTTVGRSRSTSKDSGATFTRRNRRRHQDCSAILRFLLILSSSFLPASPGEYVQIWERLYGVKGCPRNDFCEVLAHFNQLLAQGA